MGKIIFAPQSRDSRSELQKWRMKRTNKVPNGLAQFNLAAYQLEAGLATNPTSDEDVMLQYFSSVHSPLLKTIAASSSSAPSPQKIGVVFSGRQAPGCHDLLCGLADMIGSHGKLMGIVGGTQGLFAKHAVELTPDMCRSYKGTGGLDLLGRTVDRMKSDDELEKARKACEELQLTGLVLVGGTRTHTDAAYLTEFFKKKGQNTTIIGVPCGIEGSMVNEFVEASVGFDSSSKAMAQLVGNTASDGSSARKYYYFLKMMDGSSTGGKIPTSHVALEVALLTKPNLLLLTEEVDGKRMSLRDLVCHIANIVEHRAADGKNFGTIIVAEGLLEAIPEFRNLISELEGIPMPSPVETVLQHLTSSRRSCCWSVRVTLLCSWVNLRLSD